MSFRYHMMVHFFAGEDEDSRTDAKDDFSDAERNQGVHLANHPSSAAHLMHYPILSL